MWTCFIKGLSALRSEEMMIIHHDSNKEVCKVLDVSETIQKAKFKARLDFLHNHLIVSNKFNQDMYQRRMDKEAEYMKYVVTMP